MSETAHRRSVAVYVLLVLAVVGALIGYQRHTNQHFDADAKRFKAADAQSCLNRKILISNQRVVLQILDRNITQLVKVPGPARKHFLESLRQVHRAQDKLAATPGC